MIGITIKTHTTKAIANEVVAGGSACPPPRPRDLSSVVVVRDEATPLCFNVPGLTGGERAPCYLWARAQVLWCQQGRVAAQRLGGGAEIGLAAHPWVGVSVVPRFVERPLAKGLVPARMDRLQGAHMVAEKGRGCRMGCCSIREKRVNCRWARKITNQSALSHTREVGGTSTNLPITCQQPPPATTSSTRPPPRTRAGTGPSGTTV